MNHRYRSLVIVAAAALLTFQVRASVSRNHSGEGALAEARRAIGAGNAAWEKAFRTLDAAAVASTFDEEDVNVGADGTCTKGRAAIEAAMRSYFERSGPATKTLVETGTSSSTAGPGLRARSRDRLIGYAHSVLPF